MPKSKATVSTSESDGSDNDQPRKKQKKTVAASKKQSKAGGSSADSEEKKYELGNNRFLSLQEFKGRKLVSIREYYSDPGGEMRPGKKGISLTEDQWKKLKSFVGKIDEDLEDN